MFRGPHALLSVLTWEGPTPGARCSQWALLAKTIRNPQAGLANTHRSLIAVLFLKVNIAPQRKSTLIIMSQSEMSTCPLGAENTAAVKVHQGLSGHRLLPVWPDPRDASGLETPEPQEVTRARPPGGAQREAFSPALPRGLRSLALAF